MVYYPGVPSWGAKGRVAVAKKRAGHVGVWGVEFGLWGVFCSGVCGVLFVVYEVGCV